MIKINNLSFVYKNSIPVFQNISLHLDSGIHGLLGGNGVGKSSLLRIISGLRYPTIGSCKVLGHESSKRSPKFLSTIFFLADEFFVTSNTVENYSKQVGKYYSNFSELQLYKYLSDFEIEKDRPMNTLSLGQKKKAHIAMGIALNTPVLLFDEPTNGLDIPSKTVFKKILASIHDNSRCIVITTHQVKDLENLIDPIIILDHKSVLLNNSVEEITQKVVFTTEAKKPEEAIFYTDRGFGYSTIKLNSEKVYSQVDLELLFDAAMNNKALFHQLFTKQDIEQLF